MRTSAVLMSMITCGCSTVSVEMVTLPKGEIAVRSEPKDPEPVVINTIEIEDQIQFKTWKAVILDDSFETLNEVAATLKDHPELTLVEIQGHTAKANKPKKTKRLSQDRAEAVRRYLMSQGVDGERLVARGYGEERPIADNETEEGRSRNRRVEFVVRERDGEEVAMGGGR